MLRLYSPPSLIRSRPTSGRPNSDMLQNESGMVENVGVAVEIALLSQNVEKLFLLPA